MRLHNGGFWYVQRIGNGGTYRNVFDTARRYDDVLISVDAAAVSTLFRDEFYPFRFRAEPDTIVGHLPFPSVVA